MRQVDEKDQNWVSQIQCILNTVSIIEMNLNAFIYEIESKGDGPHTSVYYFPTVNSLKSTSDNDQRQTKEDWPLDA